MFPTSPALAPVRGRPGRVARGGRETLPVLRVLLIGAAAVLAYLLLSAFDGESALADDGAAGGRPGGGLLATVLGWSGSTVSTAEIPPAAGERPPATVLPRGLPAVEGRTPAHAARGDGLRRVQAGPRAVPRAEPRRPGGTGVAPDPGRIAAVGRSAAPVTERVKDVADRVAPIVEKAKPARTLPHPLNPRDATPDPAGGLPGQVPDVVGVAPEIIGTVPDVVGVVPEVVGTVPEIIGVVPEVVGTVPDVVAVIPKVIGVVPERVPDVIGVLPELVNTLPAVIGPILPATPLAPEFPVMVPPAARTGIPSGVPVTTPPAVVTPAGAAAASRDSSPATAAVSISAPGIGSRPSGPGDPHRKQPLVGAQQAGGASGGSGQPHALSGASTVAVGYQFLFTRLAGAADHAGTVPGVPALPG